MDVLLVIIMLVLFIFLMVFIFSTALLTPLIGKRNLIFVLSLGFIVGLIGGAFFIAPLYDDMPDMARAVFTISSGSPQVITVNMSTTSNVNAFVEETKKLNGVKDVNCDKITIKTSPFNLSDWKESIEQRLPVLDPNIKEAQIPSNDTMILYLNDNSNPTELVKKVDEWLGMIGGIDVVSNLAEVSITVEPSQVDAVINQLPTDEVVVDNISGDVEDQISAFKRNLPDPNGIIIICGFIGLIVGAIGLFIDSISQLWDKINLWLALKYRENKKNKKNRKKLK
ncbi:MAG TPA: hypothetical protein PLC38_04100 [Methanobacterium sp.]|jgi:hypothetical protein|nr:MAG: hypothetical protein FGO69_03485 [Methanobacterium sp.]HOI71450.1 hypothetical protein [Methanobacterium sp.]